MANRKLNEGVGSWNKSMAFPKNRYTLRCIEEDMKIANSGSVMCQRKWEICQGEPVVIGEKSIDIDGLTLTQYATTKVKGEEGWDAEKSDKAFSRFAEDLQKCGFEGDEIDDENPPCFMKGKVVDAIVYGKEVISYQSPNAEQKAKGQKIGDPIKDANGKDIRETQLQIDQILGLSTTEINRPY